MDSQPYTVTRWVAISPAGQLIIETASSLRKNCITNARQLIDWQFTWPEMRKRGWGVDLYNITLMPAREAAHEDQA